MLWIVLMRFISDLLIYNTGKEELITSITDNLEKQKKRRANYMLSG